VAISSCTICVICCFVLLAPQIVAREDGHSLTAREAPPPPVAFVRTPAPPRAEAEPKGWMRSSIPALVHGRGGAASDHDPASAAASPKRRPAPRPAWGKWTRGSLGFESRAAAEASARDVARERRARSLSPGAVAAAKRAAGLDSQIVFGACSRGRRREASPRVSGGRSLPLQALGAETVQPPWLRPCSQPRRARSPPPPEHPGGGGLNLATQIDFGGALLPKPRHPRPQAFPNGRGLNYESAVPKFPTAAAAAAAAAASAASGQPAGKFNCSEAFRGLVFSTGAAVTRAAVAFAAPPGERRWNYESCVKVVPTARAKSGGAGWNTSASFKSLVFSGHCAKPARPTAQAFPHGRTLGFSTLQLI